MKALVQQVRVVAAGECMLDLAPIASGWKLGFAGDTFNTAVSLSRLGVPLACLTALGTDPFSLEMRGAWEAEGLDTSLVLTDPQRLPGLYAIKGDSAGERAFFYWQQQSAVRRLFALDGIDAALKSAGTPRCFTYRELLCRFLFQQNRFNLRNSPVKFAFGAETSPLTPTIGRQTGWGWITIPPAQRSPQSAPRYRLHYPPSLTNKSSLVTKLRRRRWSAGGVGAWRKSWLSWAPTGAWWHTMGGGTPTWRRSLISRSEIPRGDAFNAAYLATRLRGGTPLEAAHAGYTLDAVVVQYVGAILPRERIAELPEFKGVAG